MKGLLLGNFELEHRAILNLKRLLWIFGLSGLQDCQAMGKIDDFKIETSSKSAKILIRIFIEEFEPVVAEKEKVEYRQKSI